MSQNAGIVPFLTRALLLLAVGACSLLNGLNFSSWSPNFDYSSVDYMLRATLRGYPVITRAMIYNYVTPLAISLMTLVIAGIPAALYERIRGLKASTPVSLGIWLAAAVLLSLPMLMELASDMRLWFGVLTGLGAGDEMK